MEQLEEVATFMTYVTVLVSVAAPQVTVGVWLLVGVAGPVMEKAAGAVVSIVRATAVLPALCVPTPFVAFAVIV